MYFLSTKVTKKWNIVFYGSHYLLGAKDSQAINQVITRLLKHFLLTGKLPCNRKKIAGEFSLTLPKLHYTPNQLWQACTWKNGQLLFVEKCGKGSCTYYVITDRGEGSLQMITVLHRGGPANGYSIT